MGKPWALSYKVVIGIRTEYKIQYVNIFCALSKYSFLQQYIKLLAINLELSHIK